MSSTRSSTPPPLTRKTMLVTTFFIVNLKGYSSFDKITCYCGHQRRANYLVTIAKLLSQKCAKNLSKNRNYMFIFY